MTSISCVIPCYNGARFLRETLDAALGQSYPPGEILLVDDGSTDDSAAIAESYGPPVRVIRQANRGESAARNRGMDEARGQWIALLDADDLWEPDKLQRQSSALSAAGGDVVCVYTDFYYLENGVRTRTVGFPENHLHEDYLARMLSDATVNTSSAWIRADVARQVRFPEETRAAEDMIFFAHLRDHGPFLRVPEPLVAYRRTGSNQSIADDHTLRAVQSCHRWFATRADRHSPQQQQQVRQRLAAKLVEAHDLAYWRRHHDVVVRCRAYHRQLLPEAERLPESFHWRLFPASLMRLKDKLDTLRAPRL